MRDAPYIVFQINRVHLWWGWLAYHWPWGKCSGAKFVSEYKDGVEMDVGGVLSWSLWFVGRNSKK